MEQKSPGSSSNSTSPGPVVNLAAMTPDEIERRRQYALYLYMKKKKEEQQRRGDAPSGPGSSGSYGQRSFQGQSPYSSTRTGATPASAPNYSSIATSSTRDLASLGMMNAASEERDGELVSSQDLESRPATSATGIEGGVDELDDHRENDDDAFMLPSAGIRGYMQDAESRKAGKQFENQMRTIDMMAHNERTEEDGEVSHENVLRRIDNSKLKALPDSFVATEQPHLDKIRMRGGFQLTEDMSRFQSSICNHFFVNAAAQFVMTLNANRLNPHGPMEGFGLYLIEESNYEVKKPLPASFIFTPNKYGYGCFAARISPPSEMPSTATLYDKVLTFGGHCEPRERALDELHEYCLGADLQYPSSCCGVYLSMENAEPVLWLCVLEGDKEVNEDFQELVNSGVREGYDWRSTFFSKGEGSNSKVQALNLRATKRRKELADGAIKALGVAEGLEACDTQIDSPFYRMQYKQSTRFFSYMAGVCDVEEAEHYLLARTPLTGFTIFSGDLSNQNRVGVERYIGGKDDCRYSLPAFTGKARLLSEVEAGKVRHDSNPFIINLAQEKQFARKLGNVYHDINFSFHFVLHEMGLHPLAKRQDLAPMICVISDQEDDDYAHVNTLFEDLVG